MKDKYTASIAIGVLITAIVVYSAATSDRWAVNLTIWITWLNFIFILLVALGEVFFSRYPQGRLEYLQEGVAGNRNHLVIVSTILGFVRFLSMAAIGSFTIAGILAFSQLLEYLIVNAQVKELELYNKGTSNQIET